MTLKYVIFIIFIAAVVISMVGIGFASRMPAQSGTAEVKFTDLVSSPEKYHDREVITDAFIFMGFETNVLCESLELSGLAPEHLIPRGTVIWIEGGAPPKVYDVLHIQQINGTVERYGKVRISGKFMYGGQYGHLGSYNFQIIPAKITLLIWAP